MMDSSNIHNKVAFDLGCWYKTTPKNIPQCNSSLRNLFQLERIQKKLPCWNISFQQVSEKPSNLGSGANTIRLLQPGIRFTHKWTTYANENTARLAYRAAGNVVNTIMKNLDYASVKERGTLRGPNIRLLALKQTNQPGRVNDAREIHDLFYYSYEVGEESRDGGVGAFFGQHAGYKEMRPRGLYLEYDALEGVSDRLSEENREHKRAWHIVKTSTMLTESPKQRDVDKSISAVKKSIRWHREVLALFRYALDDTAYYRRYLGKISWASNTGVPSTELLVRQSSATQDIIVVDLEKAMAAKWRTKVMSWLGYGDGGASRAREMREWYEKAPARAGELARNAHKLQAMVAEFEASIDQLGITTRGFAGAASVLTKWREVQGMMDRSGADANELRMLSGWCCSLSNLASWEKRKASVDKWMTLTEKEETAVLAEAQGLLLCLGKHDADLKLFYKAHQRFTRDVDLKKQLENGVAYRLAGEKDLWESDNDEDYGKEK